MLWRIPKGCRRCKAKAESLRQKDRESLSINMFSDTSPELLIFSAVFYLEEKKNGTDPTQHRADHQQLPVRLQSNYFACWLRPVFLYQDKVRSGALLR